MSLQRCLAATADAPRIADIHMAAFESNGMLLAQFPTAAVRSGLRESIARKAAADILDPNVTVLVVKDCHAKCSTNIVSFAKWSHPVSEAAAYEEVPWAWPDGASDAMLSVWGSKLDEVYERLMGQRPCYRLTFIGTMPSQQRRGAGQLLMAWAMERSKTENIPLYLESTVEAASFYERLGFTAIEKVELRYVNSFGKSETYTEIVFTF
ncbi:hypothetical protein LTR15_000478 [Elasticomyces elasticus]|nr:hypothetical protein LTR15_000478 [Elasticomyces elasticus]